jgi:hypothetical protein
MRGMRLLAPRVEFVHKSEMGATCIGALRLWLCPDAATMELIPPNCAAIVRAGRRAPTRFDTCHY